MPLITSRSNTVAPAAVKNNVDSINTEEKEVYDPVKAERRFEKKFNKQYSNKKKSAALTCFCIIATILLAAVAAFLVASAVIYNFYKPIIITTTIAPTTTRYGNLTKLAIGQICLYSNQCPEKSFCSGTCRCPTHHYFDTSTGSCTARKSNGVACTSDFECNQFVGLRCVSGTCQCETITQVWNSTYFTLIGAGGGSGRCQNKKRHGMYCIGSEGVQGITYTTVAWGSTIRRCLCDPSASGYTTLDLLTGNCKYSRRMTDDICNSGNECYADEQMCVDLARTGKKRCMPIPSMFYYSNGYSAKRTNGASCSYPSLQCDDTKGLYCNKATGACQCKDQYQYYNGTATTSMCLFGSKYGEVCTSATQCVPSTAGLICDFPFTGASYKACRCTIGTHYFDPKTRTCQTLKTFNASCTDSTECAGSSTNIIYCGMYDNGSQLRCICADGYYPSGTTCISKLNRLAGCSQTYQCMDHLNQICTGGACNCATGKYYDSTDTSCKYLKYYQDACSSGSECYSGTCLSPSCTL